MGIFRKIKPCFEIKLTGYEDIDTTFTFNNILKVFLKLKQGIETGKQRYSET